MNQKPWQTLADLFRPLISRFNRKREFQPAADSSGWEPVLYPQWEGLIPPRELWEQPRDSIVHFFRWTWEYRAYLTLLCGLRPDSAVLEVGCSHGRTMLGLIEYLRPPGRYEGLDIVREKIEFAQHQIHPVAPHCGFTAANVSNPAYYDHPQAQPPELFRFPYADASFDVVFAASVFTHLQPAAAANYFKESRRTLKRGGQCLFSFFVLDYYRGPGTTSWSGYEFEHPLPGFPGVAIHDQALPERLVAYRSDVLGAMAAAAGLLLQRLVPGYWSMARGWSVNEQDLLVLEAL